MAFNDRQYSLLRYSVNPAAKEAPISVSFLEGMNAVAGAAVQVALAERLTEAVHGSARGTVSLVSAFAASSGLLADVTLSANEAVAADLAETLQASVTGSKDACVTLAALDGLFLHWLWYRCPSCGGRLNWTARWTYCPHCGAWIDYDKQ